MLKILFKTSIRNILRNGTNSAINLMSLIIGITISIVIYTFLQYQFTFDHHHTNAERVYRVNFVSKQIWGKVHPDQIAAAARTMQRSRGRRPGRGRPPRRDCAPCRSCSSPERRDGRRDSEFRRDRRHRARAISALVGSLPIPRGSA